MTRSVFNSINIRARASAAMLAVLSVLGCASQRLEATPNFLRKLRNPSDGCSACHTISPRLNEFGYKFRAAGYRLPNQIGEREDKPFELGDYFAGGITANYTANKTETGPVSSHTNQFAFDNVHLWPFTGSMAGNYATKIELTFGPKGVFGFNAAYMRYTRGSNDKFLSARFGVLPKEGYGASDRGVGLSSPLFTGAANYNQSQYFSFQSSAGGEFGYYYKRTAIIGQITNGIVLFNENGTITAYGAQGGALIKPGGQVTSSSPDFQIIANQILTSNGGGIYLQLYHGHSGIPYVGSKTQFYKNEFDRAVLYGSYPVHKRLLLLGGYSAGRDHLETGETFGSGGWFASAEVPIIVEGSAPITAGYRHDFFDPAKTKLLNEAAAETAFISLFTHSGVRLAGEFQHRNTDRGVNPNQLFNQFQVRLEYYR